MQSTIEVKSESANIRADIQRTRERLDQWNQRRGELVFLVRKDPACQHRLKREPISSV